MIASYMEILLATCLLILPLLYQSSHVFRYYLKFSLYTFVCMSSAAILVPVFCLKPKDVRNLVTGAYFCRIVSPIIGLQWILRGKEHLQEDRACIIVSNHQSVLDILGMFDFWHVMDKCTVIAKKEIFYFWPFGLGAWLAGLIFIPRMQTEKSKAIMEEAADMIKEKKIKLWVFPEGTRRNDGQIHPFKKGAFHLAIKSQLPILPIVYSQYYFLDSKKKRCDKGKVIVTALPPISTEGKTPEDVEDLIRETREKMTTTFHEVNKELKASLSFNEDISN